MFKWLQLSFRHCRKSVIVKWEIYCDSCFWVKTLIDHFVHCVFCWRKLEVWTFIVQEEEIHSCSSGKLVHTGKSCENDFLKVVVEYHSFPRDLKSYYKKRSDRIIVIQKTRGKWLPIGCTSTSSISSNFTSHSIINRSNRYQHIMVSF